MFCWIFQSDRYAKSDLISHNRNLSFWASMMDSIAGCINFFCTGPVLRGHAINFRSFIKFIMILQHQTKVRVEKFVAVNMTAK